ncbi:cell division protein FtsZ [Betaproteobacteria bacterium]|nr:cell division protein FtsZ [Betaproteobacteria bacterium]GHU41135.1 cell division protein FtsZ [Betaproteobacteria bacterium]
MQHDRESGVCIKVVGVGGAGCSAVDYMLREGVQGVEFIAVDTDVQALSRCQAASKLTLNKPVAAADRELIVAQLSGADMVIVVVGMGGDSGVNAAPAVVEVARELDIFTVGVVSKPFSFEGRERMNNAEMDITAFVRYVDSLIVIPNDKLIEVKSEDASLINEYFKAADVAFRNAVSGIAEILTVPGLVSVDIEDVCLIMGESGYAMLGYAVASGADRAHVAAKQALSSPLLEAANLSEVKGLLVNITAARRTLKMKEVREVMTIVNEGATEGTNIIFGAIYDENMGEQLRVTVIVAG